MKMKVIELLNKISKGENPDFKMNGGSYKNSVWSFINMYFGHKILTFEEIICWLNAEVEIIEDEEEIDIQSIEEVNHYNIVSAIKGKTEENIDNELKLNSLAINKIIKAIKQLDKKVNSIEQK